MKCIKLQKGSGYEDSMIATYETTCLPWLHSALNDYSNSKVFELASAAQQLLV
jgi:hypothetical protein